jgi:hypothetical protein
MIVYVLFFITKSVSKRKVFIIFIKNLKKKKNIFSRFFMRFFLGGFFGWVFLGWVSLGGYRILLATLAQGQDRAELPGLGRPHD